MPDRGGLRLRGREFVWGSRTYVMGIVNVTPDSFSGDGRVDVESAIVHARAQWDLGADLLDIGGESTRPGHAPVDEATELARVIPVVAAVREQLPSAPISIDSYKPAVVRAAFEAGADVVNCVYGAPDDLLALAVRYEMPFVAMHNQQGTHYDGDVVDAVVTSLERIAAHALSAGIPREAFIVDPGIGFGKTADQNIAVLRGLERLTAIGLPTMLGASRKSTLGKLTGRPPEERIVATAATTALAIASGIDIVRVHDVAAARDAVAVGDAVVRDWRPHPWTE
jgi:dihydropteroate synthase